MTPQTIPAQSQADQRPPAPNPAASYPPPTPRPATFTPGPGAAPRPIKSSRPWRERLPELVGGIGTVLVIAAVTGFLSGTWEQLDQLGRAIVLGAAAAGLTAAAMFLEDRASRRLSALTSMLWVAGSATAGAAVLLAVSVPLTGMARVTAGIAGLAVAAHALLAARRAPSSPLRQVGVVVGLLVAAGPFGTSIADRASIDTVGQAFLPLAGLVDPSLADDAFVLTGIAHLLIGTAWLLWSHRSTGLVARVGTAGSTAILAYAALELHVLPWGIGAFAALMLVLAYLVHGLVEERTGVVVAGAIGVLIAGGRVVWSLFSGEIAVTIAAFTVGLGLLTWAVKARSGDETDEVTPAVGADA